MELKKEVFQTAVFGAEKELEFSIDTESSVIFDILRDKMYTNKIAAVCREVASNSRDANIEAGRSEMPIKISIVEPFELDCISDKSIIFGDNGPGITPDRMADVFVKYAASTKRSNNEQVGGFGLGAKTPFAYSDTFTVITVCDVKDEEGETERMRYVYTAMIDETQRGKMILFDADETDEETGTQIVVPFDDNDRYSFEKEVHKFTSLWEVTPDLVGFQYKFQDIELVVDLPGIKVVSDKDQLIGSPFVALIEGIPYGVDTTALNLDLGYEQKNFLSYGLSNESIILLEFNTGELGVSANREGIHYTDETVELLQEAIKKIITTFGTEVSNFLRADTYVETVVRDSEMQKAIRFM